jgi:uncharacterized SAM-binding protein YcdF (DUF218 family)
MEIRYLLKAILLPPFTQIIFLLVAWQIRQRMPRLAKAICILAVLSLWILGTPIASTRLALSLEQNAALLPTQLSTVHVDAIVILSGSQNENTPEFGEPVSDGEVLSRIRYGAFLHRRTGVPVLLSGGSVQGNEHRSLAETMAFDLLDGFGITALWLERKSRTTAENARYSYAILGAENKTSIVLVTSALHMMRAKWSFEKAGFDVLPAPTGFIDPSPLSVNSFLPSAHSLQLSSDITHEWLGYWLYKMLY